MTEPTFAEVYRDLAEDALSPETVRRVFDAILAGAWTPIQVAAFIATLRLKGESPGVIGAAAQAMRSAMVAVSHPFDAVLDTCGTGGDGAASLNLSTGAAVIAAAAGAVVAKHGNRAISSRAGSADVLEALGIPTDLPAAAASELLAEVRIAFMLATTHHPAMRHAGQARRELGIRTIFNCLGPLANPARATHQLIGTYDDRLRAVMAETLRALGTRRAWVVRGADGLDEISPCGPTRITELSSDTLTEIVVTPEDFGLAPCDTSAIAGGDAAHNAAILTAVIAGEPHPSRDAFLLNAAAALVVLEALPFKAAAERAREALSSGAAAKTLQSWREAARSKKPLPD